jgi:hypothetical protein
MLALIAAASIAADQNASVDTAYFDMYAEGGRCMHLHLHRDESRSGHLDLVSEGDHPWTIDLVTVTAAVILVVSFAGALVAHLVR